MEESFRKQVYCQIEFLEKVLFPDKDDSFSLENIKDAEILMSLRKLTTNRFIVLNLNITKDKYAIIMSQINKKRIKAAKRDAKPELSSFEKALCELDLLAMDGKLRIKCVGDFVIPDIKILKKDDRRLLNAIYLCLDEEKVDTNAIKQLGILVITPSTFQDIRKLIIDNGCYIKKNIANGWDYFINVSKVPCNSLAIIDNYCLNDINYIEENLKPLFSGLLPQELAEGLIFEIAIFTYMGNDIDPEGRLKRFKEIIKNIRPKLSFEVSLFKCDASAFHDRCILTNNLWISCGGGFNLFKKGKATKHTTVNLLQPFLCNFSPWASEAFSNIIVEMRCQSEKKLLFGENNINYKFPEYFIGSKELRLLE